LERPVEAYRGDEPYIFICYAHDDQAVVYPEITWLHEQGVNVWYDEGISPGEEWSEELGQAIERAERFLYFVSPTSVASRHCRNELNFAQNHDRPILSVYLEPTELPSGVELVISASQAILKPDLSATDYRARLLRALGWSGEGEPTVPVPRTRRRVRRKVSWAVALVCLAALAGFGYWLLKERSAPRFDFSRSIVVLPLSVVGDDAVAGTYADALREELRTEVAGYQELRTVSTAGATSPRDVHGTSYAFGGNVQRLGERLRLRARLTRTADRQTVWSETFERPVADVVADPAEMATTVGRFVRLQLVQDHQCETVRRATRSDEAAAAYCAALAERSRFVQVGTADFSLILSSAQRALALDPSIADAYGIVAGALQGLAFAGAVDWREAARRAHAALDQGLVLAPHDPRLLNVRGGVHHQLDLDYSAAEASYRESLASDPIHPDAHKNHESLAHVALTRGNVDDALDHGARALRIYDSDVNVFLINAISLSVAGHYRDAIQSADAGLKLVQSGPIRAYLIILKAFAQAALGEPGNANATLDDGLASVGREFTIFLTGSMARLGRTEEARQSLADLEALEHPHVWAVWTMATAYPALDAGLAFDWVRQAIDRHNIPVVTSLRFDTRYDELRGDPRWTEVMRHLEKEETKTRAGTSNSGE
jgi:TolB-like protein